MSLPFAIFCGAPHPLDAAVLCARLDGHSGTHCAHDSDPWLDPSTDEGDRP